MWVGLELGSVGVGFVGFVVVVVDHLGMLHGVNDWPWIVHIGGKHDTLFVWRL